MRLTSRENWSLLLNSTLNVPFSWRVSRTSEPSTKRSKLASPGQLPNDWVGREARTESAGGKGPPEVVAEEEAHVGPECITDSEELGLEPVAIGVVIQLGLIALHVAVDAGRR